MDLFFMCNHCGVEIKIATSQPGPVLSCPLCSTINHPPAQRLEHGSILAGYRILHRIEATGATETYLAELLENHSLNRLQTFASATFENGPAAEYYLTAMQQWMKVRQPNIVKVLDAGRSSTGTFFAASAPIAGITLENRLWQGGAMDLKSAIHLAMYLSRILEWLWKEHGLIYGQLTPRNIILTPERNIFLSHMALGPILQTRPPDISLKEFVSGTPGFTCPEHFSAPDSLDCRGDMYSLGATLYHMLTGKPPFACLDAGEIRAQQASPSLADPRLFRPDLPDEFVWLLEILLAHDPKDRFDDWNNLITILASFDFGKTVAQQKMIKSHSVMIRLPRSDIEKLTRHAKPQPVQGLHPTPPQPKSKHHWGIVLGIAVIFSTVLIILALFAIREDSKRLNCPQESLLPFQTTSQDDVNAALRTGPITETAKPSPGTTRFMALLIETRKFARQNPHKYEEILDRYEQLLAMAETNAPRWVPDLERQVRAIDLSMAAPLDDAEQAIRLRVRQFEDSGQYQAGIEWLEKYSGSFVNKTKRIRHSLANILKSRLDESSQGK